MAEHVHSVTASSRWPALVARTSGELLGRRPLPRVIAERPVVFVLGPAAVGKTSVAMRLLGDACVSVHGDGLRRALNHAARYRMFPAPMIEAPGLLLDRLDYLSGRLGPIDLLGRLLAERTAAGRRTVVCQGGDTSCMLLAAALEPEMRATLVLRFPVGRGRRRFVVARCRARGIDFLRARDAVTMEPWSYDAVEAWLDGVLQSPPDSPAT